MAHVTYTDLRNNLAKYMDAVVQDGTELHVTRQDHEGVVLMSEREFASWQETVHLLSSPANATRLMESIAQAEAGELIPAEPD
jgi:antitoxin YefM